MRCTKKEIVFILILNALHIHCRTVLKAKNANGTYKFMTLKSEQSLECVCGYEGTCSFNDKGQKICDCNVGFSVKRVNYKDVCEACSCGENGRCSFDEEGRKVCDCYSGYSLKNYNEEDLCFACNCGAHGICSFDIEGRKVCYCNPGYSIKIDQEGDLCVACNCGAHGICSFDNEGRKVCYCNPGYSIKIDQEEDFCAACSCGEIGICSFDVKGRKVCYCYSGYSLKSDHEEDFCVECDCGIAGSYTGTCHFNNDNEKVCSCDTGYAFKDDKCEECDCGPYGLCDFVDGRKKCKCTFLTGELDGKCVDCKCGKNSIGCSFRANGTKVCRCDYGYENIGDICTASCSCGPYGLCKFEFGRKKCICSPNFIESNGKCIAMKTSTLVTSESSDTTIVLSSTTSSCDCGEAAVSCSFDWFGQKRCTCLKGYEAENGYCIAMKTSTLVTSESSDTTRILSSTISSCDCGEATVSCSFDWFGQKRCTCLKGYVAENGYCIAMTTKTEVITTQTSTILTSTTPECDCGENGKCIFENGLKQCRCLKNYSEINGTCKYCSCGENSYLCYYHGKGDKKCLCYGKHLDNNGTCEECFCGFSGSCRFVNGRKQCKCGPRSVEINGFCYLVSTTEKTTAGISTSLTSSTPDCDCGSRARCIFEYGRKKCICDPFASIKDGKCVDCYCGENSNSCHFNWYGNKVCNCTSGYAQVHGFCFAKCIEDKCVHGKCEIGEYGFKCRCNEGFTGKRCDEKIQIKPNKQDLWSILQLSVAFATFILLSGMFCFWTAILTKLSKK